MSDAIPTQDALFDVAASPVVKVNPVKCDDCMLALALAKGHGPTSRQAKWRRKQGNADLLLCFAHAEIRREEDGLDPLEDVY